MKKLSDGVSLEAQLPVLRLKACLDQLHDEAKSQGFGLVALLIGAALEAMVEEESFCETNPSTHRSHTVQ